LQNQNASAPKISDEAKRRKSTKANGKTQSWKQLSNARKRDEEFLRHGPPELTKLYKPLSMNMSKHHKGDCIEFDGRYNFEELDFDGECDRPRQEIIANRY
jgi:aspartyl-tRNA synthetase